MNHLRALTIGVLAFASVSWLSADAIVNSSGRRFEGQIIRETTSSVTILLAGGMEVTLPKNRIESIERQDQWENMVLLGDHQAKQENFERAAERYEQALQANPPEDQIPAIRSRIAAVQASISEVLDIERTQQISSIDGLIERARTQLGENDWQRALESIDSAIALHPTSEQLAALEDLRADALYTKAWRLYDRRDPVGAVVVLDELLALDPNHEMGRALNSRIVEEQTIDTPEVIEEIKAIVEEDPSRLDLHYRIANYHMRNRDFAEALPHLLEADRDPRYHSAVQRHLRTVMISRVERAANQGDYDEAISMYERVLERFSDEDPHYLNVLIYRQSVQGLEDGDLEGRMDLAEQCRENGFEQWAREQMEFVLQAEPNNERARQMDYSYAQADFEDARSIVAQGNLRLGRARLVRFIEQYAYQDLNEAASVELANIDRRLAEQQRSQAEQAQEFRSAGDEYYNMGRRNYELWRNSRETEQRTSVYIRGQSRHDEIIHFYDQAIFCYETALNLDPSLRATVGLRLTDVRNERRQLTSGYIPPREPWLSRN